MNELIKVSRDAFNYSSDFEELKLFFNTKLNYYSNRLEEEDTLLKEIRQTGKEFRVNNLSLLNMETIGKKLEKLQGEGFEVMDDVLPHQNTNGREEHKTRLLSKEVSSLEKHITIKGKRFRVQSDKWDFESNFFPACIIEKNTIKLNDNYPLFKGKKYTDIFVKLHLLFVLNFVEGIIDKETFTHLTNEVLAFYSDYK